jgi:2-keto-3-deoxy-L-rhamnonate aldolase RhmA
MCLCTVSIRVFPRNSASPLISCGTASTRGWMCECYKAMNVAPIVRIPFCSAYEAFAAIEDGAVGVVSPYLETVEEIDVLIGAVKYRPLKGKRLQQVLAQET